MSETNSGTGSGPGDQYPPGQGAPPEPPPPPDFAARPPPPPPGAGSNEFVDESGASLWVRALYMVLFGFVAYVVLIVVFVASALQLVVFLVGGKPNAELRHFGREMLNYLTLVIRFLMFLDDTKPFPFSPFPKDGTP